MKAVMSISSKEKIHDISKLGRSKSKNPGSAELTLCLGHGKELPMRSEENQAGVTSLEPNEERISRRREQSAVSNDSAGSSEMRRQKIDT